MDPKRSRSTHDLHLLPRPLPPCYRLLLQRTGSRVRAVRQRVLGVVQAASEPTVG